jgi:hypothetical protein
MFVPAFGTTVPPGKKRFPKALDGGRFGTIGWAETRLFVASPSNVSTATIAGVRMVMGRLLADKV